MRKCREPFYANDLRRFAQGWAFFLAVAICAIAALAITDFPHTAPSNIHDFAIDARINPNNAPAVSLTRLPGIGPSRAAAIIDYRKQNGTESVAFKEPSDLQNIKGIGPKTVEKIKPWICFE